MTHSIHNTYWQNNRRKTVYFSPNGRNTDRELLKCTGVYIYSKESITKIPSSLSVNFPNMVALEIESCSLSKLSRIDMRGLENLQEIKLTRMQIEELPSDLFVDLPNLEVIDLSYNHINLIGKDVFKPLRKLVFVNLTGNISVDVVYACDNNLKFEIPINTKLSRRFEEFTAILEAASFKQRQIVEKIVEKVQIILPQRTPEKVKPRSLSGSYGLNPSRPQHAKAIVPLKVVKPPPSLIPRSTQTENPLENVYDDIQNMLQCEDLKDLIVKIDKTLFKVHKFMLAARSSVIAEMIKGKPDAKEIILTDIEAETFKIILDFIYTDKMPEKYDENSLKIAAAAETLKLEPLKLKLSGIISKAVIPKNSFEIFEFASKHDHKELKIKSFGEFKKLFPKKNLKSDLMNDIGAMKKLIDSKNLYEKKMNEAIKDFQTFMS